MIFFTKIPNKKIGGGTGRGGAIFFLRKNPNLIFIFIFLGEGAIVSEFLY